MIEAKPLTHERLKAVLAYDAETGLFIWKVRTGRRVKVGDQAGVISSTIGYRLIRIDRTLYLAHRLAYFYQTGAWPEGEIDHINGAKTDNSYANLRIATRSQNMYNVGKRKSNKCGLKGVSLSRGRWVAEILVEGKKRHVGAFDTPEAAYAAYVEAAHRYHGEFARV